MEAAGSASRSASSVWCTLLYQLYSLARNDEAQDTNLLEACTNAFQNPKASNPMPMDRRAKQTGALDSHYRKDDDLPE